MKSFFTALTFCLLSTSVFAADQIPGYELITSTNPEYRALITSVTTYIQNSSLASDDKSDCFFVKIKTPVTLDSNAMVFNIYRSLTGTNPRLIFRGYTPNHLHIYAITVNLSADGRDISKITYSLSQVTPSFANNGTIDHPILQAVERHSSIENFVCEQ